ncbi:hypothetical protein WME95_35765 [Sorangium sp. So ce327]|jgi:hypothetical protein|uniref:hypothetical protein n=1 Tax=Sorangium sp. So ce327 TaxID=3133301 RepID=UPI003F616455
MSRRPVWQQLYQRFDPLLPAQDRASRADRERSPAGDIATLLGMPFAEARVLLTGTVGTGKSTELLRIAEGRMADDFVVVLDLHRHFSQVMGDEQALERVESWEVVFLAGVALVRAITDLLPYPIPQQHLDDLARAWRKLAEITRTPGEAEVDIPGLAKAMIVLGSQVAAPLGGGAAADAGLKVLDALAGAMRWKLPIGRGKRPPPDQDDHMQTLLVAVNTIIGHVQNKFRRVLFVIDGLDRIRDFERANALFLRSELIAQLACRVVVCGPFALRSHPAASAIPRFSRIHVLVNEPVMRKDRPSEHGPGVPFFCELYQRRTADLDAPDLITGDLLERLAYYSGGRARDFVKSIRMLAEVGWTSDAERATRPLVDKVLNEARLLLEMGLDAGHIEVLETIADDPLRRLPADPRARDLLSYGQLLPYPNDSEWYYPHPLLTMHLVRTNRAGSTG